MRAILIAVFLGSIALLASCSSGAPLLPDSQQPLSNMVLADESQNMSSTGIWGLYKVEIDKSNLTFNLEPFFTRTGALGEQYLGDITGFLTSLFCVDCVQIDGVALTEDNLVDVSISIRHPFELPHAGPATASNRLDLHLFDVEGLVLTNEGTFFQDLEITARPDFLVNADGYSGIYDTVLDQIYHTNNTLHPYRIFFEDSSEGNFDSESLTTGFSDPLHPSGHNVFPQGSGFQSAAFRFNPPVGGTIEFVLALTASYGVSAKYGIPDDQLGNRLMPRYFLPRFNRQEAWKIQVSVPSYLNFMTSGSTTESAEVRIDVWDWQDGKPISTSWDFHTSRAGQINLKSDINTVAVAIPALLPNPILLSSSNGTGRNPRRFVGSISNALAAPPGIYTGIVCVIDDLDGDMSLVGMKRDGKTPFLYHGIKTWQFFPIEVRMTSNGIPDNPLDVTPSGLNGVPVDIVVNGNYAYVTVGLLGLMILDVSDPSSPVYVSSIATYGTAGRMAYDSDRKLLFIANGESGLVMINVANPSMPSIRGSYNTAGLDDVRDVVLYGNYAYLGDGNSGVAVLNVSDPSVPAFKGFYDENPEVRALAIEESFLCKLDETGGLEIISLANPENPSSISELFMIGAKRDVDVRGGVAVILMQDRLVTADVSNPYAPVLKGSVSFTPSGESVFLMPGYAFVSDGNAGFKVISLADVTSPKIVAGYDTPGWASAAFVTETQAFVADGDGGVIVLTQVSGQPILTGRFLTTGYSSGLAINEKNLYVATGNSGVKVVDIESPESARILTFENTPGYASSCTTADNALYVADSASGLAILSIENPSQPEYLSNLQFPSWDNWKVGGIKLRGNLAVLWGAQSESDFPDLILVDASIRLTPEQISVLSTTRDFSDIAIAGSYIFAAAGSSGVASVNIANPLNPDFVGIYSNSKKCNTIAEDNDLIYAMFEDSGMEVLGREDPENLVFLGKLDLTGSAKDIYQSGSYLYTNDIDSFVVIDISNTLNPSVLARLPIPDSPLEILIRGNYAFIAAGDAGLRIIKLW